MIWKSILLSTVYILFAVLDVLGIIDVSWHTIAMLAIASIPILLPIMSKYMVKFKAGKEGIEGEFREGITKSESAPPVFAPSKKSTQQISKYDLFSVYSRKILKTLWTHQLEYFGEDSKQRWGFTVNEGSPDFFGFHRGIGELMYHQFVFSDAGGLHFLTDAGIEFCKRNRTTIESEPYIYTNFASLE